MMCLAKVLTFATLGKMLAKLMLSVMFIGLQTLTETVPMLHNNLHQHVLNLQVFLSVEDGIEEDISSQSRFTTPPTTPSVHCPSFLRRDVTTPRMAN